ncbi:MAG: GFA family protein [Sneathiella sp.]|nr:GFA family protein [Sneathiella sp.]
MLKMISGECLCSEVMYEIENTFSRFFLCHCEQCRRISGSAFAANLFGDPAQFKWLDGEEKVRTFKLLNRDITKAFCKNCGSGVPFFNTHQTAVIVPAGSLNAEPHFSAQDKIFMNEQTDWCRAIDTAALFDTFPKE